MTQSLRLDPAAMGRQFERQARKGRTDGFLIDEVDRGMLDRLEPVRLEPGCVLDAGCGAGAALPGLARRFPGAQIVAFDRAGAALARAAARLAPPRLGWLSRWLRRSDAQAPGAPTLLARASPLELPLPGGSVDLIWSRLMLHWHAPLAPLLAEWYRVIRPGGLVSFSCFGVDTLAELRGVGARLMEFPDMHDIGDALVAAGFAEPVVDTERLTVTWRDPEALIADLRSLGGNALTGRNAGLCTPRMRERWLKALLSLRRDDGLIAIHFELIFGQAWCPPHKRLPEGLAPIRLVSRKP